MSIVSYAQNFEDVMLWRALSHVEHGFYIDIGAQDPLIDSVSLAFYEHGWRGIHVEPTPHYAELLRQQRSGDTVIQAAVGNGSAVLRFFEIPGTGISTADPVIAQQHRERGFDVHEITVPCIALSAIFEMCTGSEIHWLKIDVEGLEQQVLSSWGKSAARPWIVVVESTLPLTQIETHESWEATLIAYGYTPAYFDGLNRYYISDAHSELKNAFLSPPNVFDGFTLNGTASATFHHLIDTRYKEKISELLAQNEQQRQSATNEIERLTLSLATLDSAHAEQTSQTRQELESLLRTQAQREQEVATQLLAIQQQAAQEMAEQTRNHAKQTDQIQQKLETLLLSQVQREQEVAAQLRAIQQQAAQEMAEQTRNHAEREQALVQQLQAGQQELRRLERVRVLREEEHAKQTDQIQQELETLLRSQVRREQEVAAQLLAIQQQAAQGVAEQTRHHNEQERILHRQHAEREQALSQQLQAGQKEIRYLEQARTELQHQYNEQLRIEREVNQQLQQRLNTLQSELDTMRNNLSWRLTAPLRAVEGWFKPVSTQTANRVSEQPVVSSLAQPVPDTDMRGTQELVPSHPHGEIMSMTTNRPAYATQSSQTSGTPNLKALLQLEDSQFIKSAYQLLLKRHPDSEGFKYYIERIHAGVSKVKILDQIMNSPEARQLGVEIPGLCKAIRQQKMISLPLVGRVFQFFMGGGNAAAMSLNELLMRQNKEFVECAYLTLLKRAPDLEGFSYYLGRLQGGVPKIQILGQLLDSREGRASSVEIPGLRGAVMCQKIARVPLVGTILKFFIEVEGNSPFENRLRVIEQQVFQLGQNANMRFDRIEQNMATLQHLAKQNAPAVVAKTGGMHHANTDTAIIPPVKPAKPDGFNQLSPRARDIYFQLKYNSAVYARRDA